MDFLRKILSFLSFTAVFLVLFTCGFFWFWSVKMDSRNDPSAHTPLWVNKVAANCSFCYKFYKYMKNED